MQKPPIEFWFTMGSTYTYLTEMWLELKRSNRSWRRRVPVARSVRQASWPARKRPGGNDPLADAIKWHQHSRLQPQ